MPVSPNDLERTLDERFNIDKLCEGIDDTLRSIASRTTDDLPTYLEVTCVAMPRAVSTQITIRYEDVGWAKVEASHEGTERTSWTQFKFWRKLLGDDFKPTPSARSVEEALNRCESLTDYPLRRNSPGYAGEPGDVDFGGRD
jgi:hypothetical protein